MLQRSPELKSLLDRLQRRMALPIAARHAVFELPAIVTKLPAGRLLSRQGEEERRCRFLLNGFAHRYRLLSDGSRQIIGLHLPGDFVDLHFSMLHRATHNVQLLTPAKLIEIPVDAMSDLMQKHQDIAEAVWHDTLAEISVFQEWIVSLGRRDAVSKMAHLFCELGLRQEVAGLGSRTCLEIPLTQEHLADALGLTPEHTNRTWKKMEKAGLVRRDSRKVIISDWDGLASVARFSSDYLMYDY